MSSPNECRALVYDPRTMDLGLRTVPMRRPRTGEALTRVTASSICRSDLHTISGRRTPKGPLILGHEICGEVVELGEGVTADVTGRPLSEGDRVTWGIAAGCGNCSRCARGIPQKCETLFKYGHETMDTDPPLSGGFAEYCHLAPGTALFRLPDDLPDEVAVFANCAVATAAALVRTADVQAGESALIQGAGLLGLSVAAFCAERGARRVAVMDPSVERLHLATLFGATHTAPVDVKGLMPDTGFDVAFEVCGKPGVLASGIEALGIGGRYIIAGCVFPGATGEVDLYPVITRLLRLEGVHNYRPDDLGEALRLLANTGDRRPFGDVVACTYPLERHAEALAHAEAGPEVLRVAFRP